ncbi:metal-dependent transcriptional regulator [Nakamurella sp. YIM 132084]|uniref:Manganese transport regulator n=1 Tax=Nakamurella leprariae TaxID=2803911 RepID=A0A939C0F9_9ACTN|nr:metal-dependent transcriptional regulator [Nakamurella leprariae]
MPSPQTTAAQDYLKVIWGLQEWSDEPVTTSALAAKLDLAASTVSEGVKKLAAQGWVTHRRYGSIELTPTGRQYAVAFVRRHRLIETFLADVLGYAWDEVHEEAEALEHAVSDTFIDRLSQRLGHPSHDPHGDPIPRPDGTLDPMPAATLRTVELGRAVRVVRVSDSNPDLLRYLTDLGVELGLRLQVQQRETFAGTLTVLLDGGDPRPVIMGLPVADAIFVVPETG